MVDIRMKLQRVFKLCRAIVPILLLLPYPIAAADLTLKDIQSQHGIQLSAEELQQLLPGADVVNYFQESVRRWNNKAGGKFVASSDLRRHVGLLGKSSTAHGTWRIGEDGTYCVTLEWPKRSENWCRYIYKVGDKYYGVNSNAGGTAAPAHPFEFSK